MVNINFVGGNFGIVGVLLLWSVLLTEHLCIGLCCEYLQSVSVFAALFFLWFVVSISSAFLYLVVLRVFAA